MEIKNRKASHNYEFIETYNAGIVLHGNEVKSVRNGEASIGESYCVFENGELFIYNSYIAPYKYQNGFTKDTDPYRLRKLLLNRSELRKLFNAVKIKGMTIVPLRMHFVKGLLKVEIALCKGKHDYDKRESIKERENNRRLRDDFC